MRRFEDARGAQPHEPLFVHPVHAVGEVSAWRSARRGSDAELRPDGARQAVQGREITGPAPTKTRERFLAETGAGRPLGIGQPQSARFARQARQEIIKVVC